MPSRSSVRFPESKKDKSKFYNKVNLMSTTIRVAVKLKFTKLVLHVLLLTSGA